MFSRDKKLASAVRHKDWNEWRSGHTISMDTLVKALSTTGYKCILQVTINFYFIFYLSILQSPTETIAGVKY